jgi:hypothetical protein
VVSNCWGFNAAADDRAWRWPIVPGCRPGAQLQTAVRRCWGCCGHALLLLSREYFAALRPAVAGVRRPVAVRTTSVHQHAASAACGSGISLRPVSSGLQSPVRPSRRPCRWRSGVSVSVPFQGFACITLRCMIRESNVWRTTTVPINHSLTTARKISTADSVVPLT